MGGVLFFGFLQYLFIKKHIWRYIKNPCVLNQHKYRNTIFTVLVFLNLLKRYP